jgi:hypothetical protein
MDQYLPPLAAISTAVVVVCLCFVLRIPFFLVGLLSIAMAIYAFQDHILQFSYQYENPTAPNVFKQNAPIFMIIIVIALSLGFLLFRFGPKTITTNAPTAVLGQRQEKGRGGIFDGFSKMFGSQGQQQQQQYSNRRRYNNDDYARSSTYDRI